MDMKSFYIWKNNQEEFALQTSCGVGSGAWNYVVVSLNLYSGKKLAIELDDHEDQVSVDGKWKRISEIKIPIKIETYKQEKLDL